MIEWCRERKSRIQSPKVDPPRWVLEHWAQCPKHWSQKLRLGRICFTLSTETQNALGLLSSSKPLLWTGTPSTRPVSTQQRLNLGLHCITTVFYFIINTVISVSILAIFVLCPWVYRPLACLQKELPFQAADPVKFATKGSWKDQVVPYMPTALNILNKQNKTCLPPSPTQSQTQKSLHQKIKLHHCKQKINFHRELEQLSQISMNIYWKKLASKVTRVVLGALLNGVHLTSRKSYFSISWCSILIFCITTATVL